MTNAKIPMRQMTAEIPFEKNRILWTSPYVARVRKRRADDEPLELNLSEEDIAPLTPLDEEYVTAVYDYEENSELFTVAAVGNSAVWEGLRQIVKFNHPAPCMPAERDIMYKSESNTDIRYIGMFYDGMFVIRVYRFHPSCFIPGKPEGYFETARYCFKGDMCWSETYRGDVLPLNLSSLIWKRCGGNKTFYGMTAEDIEKLESMFNIKLYSHRVPKIKNSCRELPVLNFLNAYNALYRGAAINKNVPSGIKDHAMQNKTPDLEFVCDEIRYVPKPDSVVYAERNGNPFVCIQLDKNGLPKERIYFDETRMYLFGYNPFSKVWTSSKKEFAEVFEFSCDICKPLNVKGTVLEYFAKDFSELDLKTVRAMIRYPILEKLWKAGFKYSIISYMRDAKSYKADWKNDILSYNSLTQLFRTSDRCLRFVRKDISFFELDTFNQNMQIIEKYAPEFDNSAKTKLGDYVSRAWGILSNFEQFAGRDMSELICYLEKIRRYSVSHPDSNIDRELVDYAHMIDKANAYNEFLKENGCEYHIYERFPKPSALHFLHDKAARDYRYYQQLQDSERLKLQNKRIAEFTESEDYSRNLFESGDYCIIPVKTAEDLINEGRYLSHCVGSYVERVAERKSFIYFVRKKAEIDTPFFTVELIKNLNKKMDMTQCFTFHDSIDKSESCRNFLKKWGKEREINIKCKI